MGNAQELIGEAGRSQERNTDSGRDLREEKEGGEKGDEKIGRCTVEVYGREREMEED